MSDHSDSLADSRVETDGRTPHDFTLLRPDSHWSYVFARFPILNCIVAQLRTTSYNLSHHGPLYVYLAYSDSFTGDEVDFLQDFGWVSHHRDFNFLQFELGIYGQPATISRITEHSASIWRILDAFAGDEVYLLQGWLTIQ